MDDEILSFEEHRARREDNASLVRCARCGKTILATASRCPECGVHFQGEAQDFLHPDERPISAWAKPWVIAVITAGLIVLLLLSMLGVW